MKDITIREIYAGKPDAKDEINFSESDEFIKTFVVAEHFNIESLITGTNCFITGFKGTGKTALLYYLDNLLKEQDPSACSSYILFKDDFTEIRRDELKAISQRILSSITVEANALIENTEFDYIWRWLIFKRIVSDNEEYNRNLFVDDKNWEAFEHIINQIKDPINTKKALLLDKIKLALPIKDFSCNTEFGPEVELDLRDTSTDNYRKFLILIDEAEVAFSKVKKTNIPYYIFVDELEAYYGDSNIFKRDLCLIRDLVFTVKRFNSIFSSLKFRNMKIICSVRSEILNAISRFILPKEINKVINGFSVPLIWNYSNNNSHTHPIIQILLKRISVCSDTSSSTSFEIYKRWFPEPINGLEPASYILNNSWCKPRDIVRLITTAQNSIHNKNKFFSQAVFNSAFKDYSNDSLNEIKEELRALYTSEEIDDIISCFTGFRVVFSFSQIKEHINKYYSNTVLDKKLNQVLNDLYRLGFLGNYLPAGKTYHWQQKGDSVLIINDEWRMFVHYALHGALALGSRSDYGLSIGDNPQKGDVATAEITHVLNKLVLTKFILHGKTFQGFIPLREFKKMNIAYIDSLKGIVFKGDTLDVVVEEYNDEHENWRLRIVG